MHECMTCSFSTNEEDALRRHKRSHETKRFECKICSQKCLSNFKLKEHLRKHTGERPFKCPVCQFTSRYRDALRVHLKKHKRLKPDTYALLMQESRTHRSQIDLKENSVADLNLTVQTLYQCTTCSFSTNEKDALLRHKRSHTPKRFDCKICSYKCLSNFKLTEHLRKHTGKKPFKCPVCQFSSRYRDALRVHLKKHKRLKPDTYSLLVRGSPVPPSNYLEVEEDSGLDLSERGEITFSCAMCSFSTTDKAALGRHRRSHKPKLFECQICSHKFLSNSKLTEHLRKHTGEIPFKCPVCPFTSVDREALGVHLKKHKRLRPDTYAILVQESRTHRSQIDLKEKSVADLHLTVQTLYECTTCSFSTNEKDALMRHKRSHTPKRFECKICSYKCLSNFKLTEHLRKHTGEKPFKCPVCQFSSRYRDALRVHLKKHKRLKPDTYSLLVRGSPVPPSNYLEVEEDSGLDLNERGEITFSCAMCSFSTTDKAALGRHRRSHKPKLFECQICSHKCLSNSKLTEHLRKHTGEIPFKCPVCPFTSMDREALGVHLKKHKRLRPDTYAILVQGLENAGRRKPIQSSENTPTRGTKRFACQLCSYRCISNSKMNLHMRAHTGEKPFKCKMCTFSTAYGYWLKRHNRSHHSSEEKTYRCSLCSYTCNEKFTIDHHVRDKHPTGNENWLDNTSVENFVLDQREERDQTCQTLYGEDASCSQAPSPLGLKSLTGNPFSENADPSLSNKNIRDVKENEVSKRLSVDPHSAIGIPASGISGRVTRSQCNTSQEQVELDNGESSEDETEESSEPTNFSEMRQASSSLHLHGKRSVMQNMFGRMTRSQRNTSRLDNEEPLHIDDDIDVTSRPANLSKTRQATRSLHHHGELDKERVRLGRITKTVTNTINSSAKCKGRASRSQHRRAAQLVSRMMSLKQIQACGSKINEISSYHRENDIGRSRTRHHHVRAAVSVAQIKSSKCKQRGQAKDKSLIHGTNGQDASTKYERMGRVATTSQCRSGEVAVDQNVPSTNKQVGPLNDRSLGVVTKGVDVSTRYERVRRAATRSQCRSGEVAVDQNVPSTNKQVGPLNDRSLGVVTKGVDVSTRYERVRRAATRSQCRSGEVPVDQNVPSTNKQVGPLNDRSLGVVTKGVDVSTRYERVGRAATRSQCRSGEVAVDQNVPSANKQVGPMNDRSLGAVTKGVDVSTKYERIGRVVTRSQCRSGEVAVDQNVPSTNKQVGPMNDRSLGAVTKGVDVSTRYERVGCAATRSRRGKSEGVTEQTVSLKPKQVMQVDHGSLVDIANVLGSPTKRYHTGRVNRSQHGSTDELVEKNASEEATQLRQVNDKILVDASTNNEGAGRVTRFQRGGGDVSVEQTMTEEDKQPRTVKDEILVGASTNNYRWQVTLFQRCSGEESLEQYASEETMQLRQVKSETLGDVSTNNYWTDRVRRSQLGSSGGPVEQNMLEEAKQLITVDSETLVDASNMNFVEGRDTRSQYRHSDDSVEQTMMEDAKQLRQVKSKTLVDASANSSGSGRVTRFHRRRGDGSVEQTLTEEAKQQHVGQVSGRTMIDVTDSLSRREWIEESFLEQGSSIRQERHSEHAEFEEDSAWKDLDDTEEETYSCPTCAFSTDDKDALNRHTCKRSHKTKHFECSICSHKCLSNYKLTEHLRTHSGERPFKCPVCSFTTGYRDSLRAHLKKHKSLKPNAFDIQVQEVLGSLPKPKDKLKVTQAAFQLNNKGSYTCTSCSFSTKKKDAIKRHKRTHAMKRFLCSLCPFKTISNFKLMQHTRKHTGLKPYKCSICPFKTAFSYTMTVHKNEHLGIRPHKCSVCTFSSSMKCRLSRHVMTHTDEKPYKCSLCDYSCVLNVALEVHMRTHTGEKPYLCMYCSFNTHSKYSLQTHEKIHSINKPDKKRYKCSVCNKEYVCPKSYKVHLRKHSGEKPFQCDLCSYKTASKACLTSHMITHGSMRKMFKCIICAKEFTRQNTLLLHRRTHTGEMPYKCSSCPYSSAWRNCIVKHELTHN